MKRIFVFLLLVSLAVPFLIALNSIFSGGIPFWYDPARDFLAAWDNLHKVTLIGPTTGIPGIFYGPYWIWLISLGLIFTKDPRFIDFFILTLPYFILFPIILFKFQKIFGRWICLSLWLLFILSSEQYAIYLWNPHLAPLLFLAVAYLLATSTHATPKIKFFLAGVILGIILNIHLSFGMGIAFGSILYLLLLHLFFILKFRKKFKLVILASFQSLLLFSLGLILSFLPFLIFEVRHQFLQTKALFKTLTSALFYNSAVVGQTGLTKPEIIQQFINSFIKVSNLNQPLIKSLFSIIIIYLLLLLILKKLKFAAEELKLLLYLIVTFTSLFYLYLSSKNPVWSYHFIGFEIIVILFIGLIAKKLSLFKYLLILWTFFLLFQNIYQNLYNKNVSVLSFSSYANKKYIVDLILKDASHQIFKVYAYSPSIYTYDFDYLFRWQEQIKEISEDKSEKPKLVYLIVPPTKEAIKDDFINYKTPNSLYKTQKTWHILDGTDVLKRSKI